MFSDQQTISLEREMRFHVTNRNKIGEFWSQMLEVNSYNFGILWSKMPNASSPTAEPANWARLLLSLGQNSLFPGLPEDYDWFWLSLCLLLYYFWTEGKHVF